MKGKNYDGKRIESCRCWKRGNRYKEKGERLVREKGKIEREGNGWWKGVRLGRKEESDSASEEISGK